MTTTTVATSAVSKDEPPQRGRALAIVLGFTAVIAVAALAFAAPAVNSGPDDLPLAVSGPAPLVDAFSTTLDAQSPGTFEVSTYVSTGEAADAIRDREVVGGVAFGLSEVTIQTAAGAGPAYPPLLKSLGARIESSGQAVTYTELAPTTQDDPRSAGIAALGLPLVFGGMGSAAALLLGYRGSVRSRVGAALTLAVLGGLVATAILQLGFGAFDGSYWLTAVAVSVGIASIACTVLGLGTLLGYPGVLLAALLMLFVSNPLSGLANGPEWLPAPWGEVGQLLPVGAAGSAVRSAAYFDGAGATTAWLVLASWSLVGLLLAGIGASRPPRRDAPPARRPVARQPEQEGGSLAFTRRADRSRTRGPRGRAVRRPEGVVVGWRHHRYS